MNGWRDRVAEWWWDRLDRVHDWRLDRTDRVAEWWWDRVDGLDERRHRLKDELASWPLGYRLFAGAALLVVVGFLVFGQVGLERGGSPNVVAEGTSRTTAPAVPVIVPDSTPAPVPAPAATSSTTVAPTTTLEAATTTTPTTAMPVAPATTPPPTTAPPTTAPPTTTRAPVQTTTPPSTGGQLAPFCGFVPGATVEVEVNGEPVGRGTADSNGCVVVNR